MHEEIIELTYQKPYTKSQLVLGKRIKQLIETGQFEELTLEELELVLSYLQEKKKDAAII